MFAAIVGTVLLLPAASAAESKPVKDKDVAPSSLGPACNYHPGFAETDVITITVVTNRRQESKTTSPSGVKTTTSEGELFLTFAHLNSGGALIKAVTEDVGGPTTVTSYPDGRGLFEGTGKNWLSFGPLGVVGPPGLLPDHAPCRNPGFVIHSGLPADSFGNLV